MSSRWVCSSDWIADFCGSYAGRASFERRCRNIPRCPHVRWCRRRRASRSLSSRSCSCVSCATWSRSSRTSCGRCTIVSRRCSTSLRRVGPYRSSATSWSRWTRQSTSSSTAYAVATSAASSSRRSAVDACARAAARRSVPVPARTALSWFRCAACAVSEAPWLSPMALCAAHVPSTSQIRSHWWNPTTR